jgi:arylsulfatase A-like enzyme
MKMEDYLRYYYATLSAVDDSVGRIMAYLKKQGLEKDTLVVFTSDNGYQIGEHGLIDKRTAYEPSVKVPMIMVAPGTVPAGVVNPSRAPAAIRRAKRLAADHRQGHGQGLEGARLRL